MQAQEHLKAFPVQVPKLKQEAADVMPTAKDRTTLPNWVMPVVCAAFIGLIGIVYNSMKSDIAELKLAQKEAIADIRREYDKDNIRQDALIDKAQAYIQNTREWLKEHGYDFDDNGKITRRR